MKHISEGAIKYGSNHQRSCRSQQPSIGNQYAVLLQRTHHVAPTRHRLIHPEAKKREGYFGGNIPRDEQRRLSQQQAKGLRKNVTSQEVKVRSAKATSRQNVVPVSRAQH